MFPYPTLGEKIDVETESTILNETYSFEVEKLK